MNLLVVSEEPSVYYPLLNSSLFNDYHLYFCKAEEDILSVVNNNNIETIFIDSYGEEGEKFRLLKLIKSFDPLIDVIIVSESEASENTLDWINQGATDFLIRPVKAEDIGFILGKISRKRIQRKETFLLEKKLEKKYLFQGMVGKSPFMLEIFSLIEKIAAYFSTVLITGDTGTGKEMAARAIFNLNGSMSKKLVICDSASIPENLVESELFGYVKGAFTGADNDRKGLVEEAHEGILFLDEIGEIPLSLQAKLMRVLENHQFKPLGSNEDRNVELRVIAATNRNLRDEIKKGTFREDLFHRLNKIEIHLPPLKKRPEDIPLLCRYFISKLNKRFNKNIKGVSRKVQKLFLNYNWPGNVREVENVMESASILCKREFIDVTDLPKYLQKYRVSHNTSSFIKGSNFSDLKNLEKEYMIYLLEKTKNNKKKTAEILNISRTTLYNKLKKYHIST